MCGEGGLWRQGVKAINEKPATGTFAIQTHTTRVEYDYKPYLASTRSEYNLVHELLKSRTGDADDINYLIAFPYTDARPRYRGKAKRSDVKKFVVAGFTQDLGTRLSVDL
jgi:hypothetical protein